MYNIASFNSNLGRNTFNPTGFADNLRRFTDLNPKLIAQIEKQAIALSGDILSVSIEWVSCDKRKGILFSYSKFSDLLNEVVTYNIRVTTKGASRLEMVS